MEPETWRKLLIKKAREKNDDMIDDALLEDEELESLEDNQLAARAGCAQGDYDF